MTEQKFVILGIYWCCSAESFSPKSHTKSTAFIRHRHFGAFLADRTAAHTIIDYILA